MSAINAVAGTVVLLNRGSVAALNPEARKLFTHTHSGHPDKVVKRLFSGPRGRRTLRFVARVEERCHEPPSVRRAGLARSRGLAVRGIVEINQARMRCE